MTQNVSSYEATSANGRLESVDFSAVGGKHFAFFELRDPEMLPSFEGMLAAAPFHQEKITATRVKGHVMLITRGDTAPEQMLANLKKYGEQFRPYTPPKQFEPWKVRSYLGFAGQGLQLVSSFMRPKNRGKTMLDRLDTSTFVFAAANLSANAVNLTYNHGETLEDKHQLRYLKDRLNRELDPYLKKGEQLYSVNDHRAELRPQEHPKTTKEKLNGFLEKHSVAVGELGLRYFGAIALAYPARYWKDAFQGKHFPKHDPSSLRVYTGLSSIFGKTVALGSQVPDPYNPKRPGLLETLREKYAFLTGGLIEITSFSALAYDSFFNSKGKSTGIEIGGKIHRDWLGGIGASLFVMAYIVRCWAPFGERKVNMDELYAHASDTLAEIPPENVPQLLANTAASLTEHFNDHQRYRFSSIYANILNDMDKFHAQANPAAIQASRVQQTAPGLEVPTVAGTQPSPVVETQGLKHEPHASKNTGLAA